jgi:hypothetical protein
MLAIVDGDPEAPTPLGRATVDAAGDFVLELSEARPLVRLGAVGLRCASDAPPVVRVDGTAVVLECRLGLALRGTLLSGAGRPEPGDLTGIEVRLFSDRERSGAALTQAAALPRTVRSDEHGEFLFRAVPVRRDLEVWALPERFVPVSLPLGELRPGEDGQVRLVLQRGASLAGRVVDEHLNAVPDAEVLLHETPRLGWPTTELRRVKVGPEGDFALPGVPFEGAFLLVQAPGFLSRTVQPEALTEDQLRTLEPVVMRRGAALAGQVLSAAGEPVAGARIVARLDPSNLRNSGALPWRGTGAEGTADGDGRFELSGLGDLIYVVEARAPGAAAGESERLARAPGVRPGEPLTLVLAPLSRLVGRVTDRAGAPLRAFTVALRRPGPTYTRAEADERRFLSFADDDGRFEVEGLDDGAWELTVAAPGYAPRVGHEVQLPGNPEVWISLDRGLGLEGRVLDPDGRPVSGATVRLESPWIETLIEVDVRADLTDELGRFTLVDLPPGEVALLAEHPRFATSTVATFDLSSGAPPAPVELRLRRGGIVRGQAFDREGRPYAGAQVVLQSVATMRPALATADPDGRFLFEPVDPDHYQVLALGGPGPALLEEEGDGSSSGDWMAALVFESVQLAEGQEVELVLGAPASDPVEVRGRVTAAGRPAARVRVSVIGEGQGLGGLKLVEADDDGRFQVVLPAPGRYQVWVQTGVGPASGSSQNTIEFRRQVPDVEQFELDLELPSGGVRGRVTDERGAPLAGAPILAQRSDGVVYGSPYGGALCATTSDQDGRFELDLLEAGSYLVSAGGAPFGLPLGGGRTLGRQVRDDVVVRAGTWQEGVDFELRPACTLRGTVRDGNGAPVVDAVLFVRDAAGRPLERFGTVRSDALGRFEYGGLAAGSYTLSARAGDLASGDSAAVELRCAGDETVDLTVAPGTLLIVKIEVDDQFDVEARVQVLDGEGRDVGGLQGLTELMQATAARFTSDEYRIGPLPPGEYRVVATATDGRQEQRSVRLSGQSERRLRLRIQ